MFLKYKKVINPNLIVILLNFTYFNYYPFFIFINIIHMSNISILSSNLSDNKVLVDWSNTKLNDVCRSIGLFINYLLLPREGFRKHLKPDIPLPIVKYVIEEIYNCNKLKEYKKSTPYTDRFSNKCKQLLKEYITVDIVVENDVIEYLWNYIDFGVSSLLEDIEVGGISYKIRNLIRLKKKAYNELKEKMSDNENIRINYVKEKIGRFQSLINKIDNEIRNTKGSLSDEQKEANIIIFTEEEEQLLSEILKQNKIMDVLRMLNTLENEKTEAYMEGRLNEQVYIKWIKDALKTQIQQLEKLKEELYKYLSLYFFPKDIKQRTEYNEIIYYFVPSEQKIKDIDLEEVFSKMEKDKQYKITKEYISSINKKLEEDIKEAEKGGNIKKLKEKKIQQKIDVYRNIISQKICDKYDFENELKGCFLSSIIYILVALSDWLEIDYIKREEIIYSLKILLPQELSIEIDESESNDDIFKIKFIKELDKYQLKIRGQDDKYIDILSSTFKKLDRLHIGSETYKKYVNRVKYFVR